uniref:Secreted protein n=1 Tax=Ciona intestinalis TaxID=7719 RepID=H2XVC0_CIOIN
MKFQVFILQLIHFNLSFCCFPFSFVSAAPHSNIVSLALLDIFL